MKKTFEIGPGLHCDVDRLVASRLLVQANSGGGKTRTLRRLLEQSHGRLQHLVIDPEGEYHTLREHFDYVLAAPNSGDTVAHPRTAAMLAERLLQLNVSAILDIYELNPDARVLFVQRFLDALVNAPRDLWHPVLVVLDEAHVYSPEGASSPCSTAVKAMASRGRKRGFCLVPATQRLSKLSKDVAAECNNKLIGRCTLDVDIKRAAEELGFTTNEQKQGLRQLEPGQFYAYGPAFDVKAPILVHVGNVKTSHPEPGQKAAPVPAPTDKVKKVLQQLADLPAEAEEREKSLNELKAENRGLRAEVVAANKKLAAGVSQAAAVNKTTEIVHRPALTDADRALIEKLTTRLAAVELEVGNRIGKSEALVAERVVSALESHRESTQRYTEIAANDVRDILNSASVKKLLEKLNGLSQTQLPPVANRIAIPQSAQVRKLSNNRTPTPTSSTSNAHRTPPAGDGSLSGPELKILTSLAELEALGLHPSDKQQLGLMAGYTNVRSGGFSEPLGRLIAGGYATSPRTGLVAITDAGRAAVGPVDPPETPAEMQDRIMEKLTGPEQKLLRVIVARYPNTISKEDLGAECGYTNIRSGGFSEPLGRLNTLGIIETPQRGEVKASPALFLEVA